MTTTTEAGDLIKVDCIGRVRTSESQRDALLDAFGTSGMSGPEFAARHGVKYQTLPPGYKSANAVPANTRIIHLRLTFRLFHYCLRRSNRSNPQAL